MPDIIQDLLGNFCLIAAAWIVAASTPRREHFWVRTAICFTVLSLARYVYFEFFMASMSGDIARYCNMLGFFVLMLLTTGAVALAFD